MNKAIEDVIKDMKIRLNDAIANSKYYQIKFKEEEAKIASLKEAIYTLEDTLKGINDNEERSQ